MPGARVVPGRAAQLRRARLPRQATTTRVAIRHASELRDARRVDVGRAARADRARSRPACARWASARATASSAYMPNIPEAVAAFLATARRSARSGRRCSPDFGARAWSTASRRSSRRCCSRSTATATAASDFDRARRRRASCAPRCRRSSARSCCSATSTAIDGMATGTSFRGRRRDARVRAACRSTTRCGSSTRSGTTGLPKAIVHGQGGILLEHLKKLHLHVDAQAGDRVFWFTTTGWMMWNFLVGGAADRRRRSCSTTATPAHPDLDVLWDLAEQAGDDDASARARAYIAACMKAGVEPGRRAATCRALRAVGSTGSPLSPEGFRWVYEQRRRATPGCSRPAAAPTSAPRSSAACPTLPVYEGELQARALGADGRGLGRGRQAADRRGRRARDHRADAVDAGLLLGRRRTASATARATSTMYPGVWRHGDWIEITERGTAIIYGRSDSTINRGGIRMGTAEIYRAVLARRRDRRRARGRRPARGRRRTGCRCSSCCARAPSSTTTSSRRSRTRIREDCSPRHVPERGHRDRRGPAHAVGQGARGAGQADPDGRRRPRRRPAATRSPTPRRSTGSSELGEEPRVSLLAVAEEAAIAAGELLRERFEAGVERALRTKWTPTDLVSQADVAAEAAIREVPRPRGARTTPCSGEEGDDRQGADDGAALGRRPARRHAELPARASRPGA